MKPKGVVLTKSVLKTCFNHNPHGAGFAYPTKKGMVIEKGFFHFRLFWSRFRTVQSDKLPMLIHFRVATSGEIDKKNCHPWKIDDNHALIHNGVVQDKLGFDVKGCSDTGLFVKHILRPTFKRGNRVWKTPAYKWCVENSIGSKNKMVIMDKDGDFTILNEKEGKWENGVWFSNETFKTARKSTADIKDSWIEEKDDIKYSVKRRGGKITYTPIKNSFDVEEAPKTSKVSKISTSSSGVAESNKKIIGFVNKQVGTNFSAPAVHAPFELTSENSISLVQELEFEETLIGKKITPDISSMI